MGLPKPVPNPNNKYYVGENVKNAPEGTKIYTNTAFQEGDSLLFTLLEQPDETKEPKRTEKTVKIGGILKNVTDPFDGPWHHFRGHGTDRMGISIQLF